MKFLLLGGALLLSNIMLANDIFNPSDYFKEFKLLEDKLFITLKDNGIRFYCPTFKKVLAYKENLVIEKNDELILQEKNFSLTFNFISAQKLNFDNRFLIKDIVPLKKYVVLVEIKTRNSRKEYILVPYWREIETSSFRVIFRHVVAHKDYGYVIFCKAKSKSFIGQKNRFISMNTSKYEDSLLLLRDRIVNATDSLPLTDGAGKSFREHYFKLDGQFYIIISPNIIDNYTHKYWGISDTIDGKMYAKIIYSKNISSNLREKIEKALQGTFTLFVSNQSIIKADKPKLKIFINNHLFVNQVFQSDKKMLQHTLYGFNTLLPSHKYQLKINGGGIDFTKDFIVDVENDIGIFTFLRPKWYQFRKECTSFFETQKGPLLWY